MPRRQVTFFAPVRNEEVLERNEFYAQDLRILREIGLDVHIATRVSQLRLSDLYFVWWWTWAFIPISLARLTRRPSIVTGTANWHLMPSRSRVHQRLIRYALRNASANVFCSKDEYECVTQSTQVSNAIYCPLTVDTELYSPSNNQRDKTVLSICWMNTPNFYRKCVPEILRAAAIVRQSRPDVRFVIAGEKGRGFEKLEDLARQLGAAEYVEFPGVVGREQKIDLLRKCGVYLQPSRFEGFGVAILEAMSCGAPIVSSAVGAVPEVLGDTGIYVDGTHPNEIAESVIHLLQNRQTCESAGLRARRRAVDYFSYLRRKEVLQLLVDSLLTSRPIEKARLASEPVS